MATDFPKQGDDLKISLRNSEYPQFDREFAENIKEFNSEIWALGGNVRGNDAFRLWGRARDGDEAGSVLDWIKEREAWAARHFEDGAHLSDEEPNKSNVAGVVAQMKWGVIGTLGEQGMKDAILELIKKLEGKKEERQLSDQVETALENKRDEHNEEVGDDPLRRVTLGMLREVMERGIGAYKTNPESVRPGVGSPEQWGYARVNSFLFAMKNDRFQGGKHDTDLFPAGHPLASDDENEKAEYTGEMEKSEDAAVEQRHIKEVVETDDEIIITFAKPMIEEPEEEPEIEESGGDYDEERLSKSEVFHRMEHAEIEEKDDRRVEMSVSSELEVERSFGREMIVHTEQTLDLNFLRSGHAPLLLDHDPERQIGVIESVNLDGSARRLRATVRFGRGTLASEVYQDVVDGIRSNVSIGYKVRKMERDKDDQGLFRVIDAEIMEVSIVSLPADPSVGVGRSVEVSDTATIKPIEKEVPIMEQENHIDLDQVRAEAAAERSKEINEMLGLAAKHNQRSFADESIRQGMTLAQFRGALLDKIADKPLDVADVELTQKEERQYSLINAIRSAQSGRFDGFEREVSEELAKRYGKEPRGFYVPQSIFKRDLTVGTNTAGGFLKPTDHLGGEFIDALRANLVISSLGARMMQGLKGDVAIPALNAKTAVGFVAENNAPGSEGAPTFRQVTMSPKTLVQYVDISRKLSMQSDPSVEQVIRDDLTRQFAAKIDEVAIEGGGSNEPTGITQTSGIGSVAIGTNGGAITYAALVDLEKEVAIDNALGGSLAYLTNPKVVGEMRQTSRQSGGVEGNFILNDSNTILGYNVASTTLVPSDLTKGTSSGVCSAVIFGNFNDLMIGMFGGLDVLVDPYTGSSTGATRIAMYQDVDVAVRHAESFAAILDVTTA
jgi:HK97 family phage major capsid protein/HK97 family phage prohead protease